ncbi:hypothetical protein ACFWFI_04555 [Streptomyces sp. NPDC060209]|uniref:hypothetical protein n=1 Tax=Streptomyces sp. NPDC060209 TaxID=3347073 RepID=UPI0036666839
MTSWPSLLGLLRNDPKAAELAEWPFDFDIHVVRHGPITHVEPVHLASGEPLEAIAKDGGGGTYFLCGAGDGEDRPVLFADSEGSAGIIGVNLRDALLLLAALPCAGQALSLEYQGRAVDEAMLLALRQEEDEELSEAADMDDLPERRAEFLERLGLTPPPLTELLDRAREAAALEPSYVLLNEHGDAYQQA